MILDAIADFTYLQLPRDLRLVTIAVGVTETNEPLLALYGKSLEVTKNAHQFLQRRGWKILEPPRTLTSEFHAERQLSRVGNRFIGISRSDGICPACQSYFRSKLDTTIAFRDMAILVPLDSGSITWYLEPFVEPFERNFVGDDPTFASNKVYPLLYGATVELHENTAYDLQNCTPYMTYRFLRILRDLFNDEYGVLKNSDKFRARCREDLVFQSKFANGLGLIERSRAFDAIMKLKHADQVAFLLDCFQRCSVEWQAACYQELAKFRDNRAVTKLCEVLRQAEDPDLRYIAAQSLANNGDASALAALTHAVQHDTGTDYEGRPIAAVAAQAIEAIRARTTNLA